MPEELRTAQDSEGRDRIRDDPIAIERHYDRLIAEAEEKPALREFWRVSRLIYRENVARRVPDREPVWAEYGLREAL